MLRVFAILFSLVFPDVVCAQGKPAKKPEKLTKPAQFKVKKMGEPVSYLGHYTGATDIPKSELLKIDSVKIKYCFNLPTEFPVLRYRFSGIVDGQYYSIGVAGCRITKEIKAILLRVTNGDKIRFTGIVALRKDSSRANYRDISLKIIDKSDTNLITYKLKNKVPEPDLFSVKKQLPGKISRFDLLFMDQIFVKCDCKIPSYNTEFSVLEFDLKTTVKGYKVYYTAKGPDLTEEMLEAIHHTQSGTKIHIQNIKVRTGDGVVGYLSPRTFKVIP